MIATPPLLPADHVARGRPRETDIDAKFKASAVAVFADGGFAKLSVNQICKHAGHPRATFYRRWENALDVLFAAFDERFSETGFVDTGDIRADLLTYAQLIRWRYDDPVVSQCLPFIFVEMHRRSKLARPFALAQKKRRAINQRAIEVALRDQQIATTMTGGEILALISASLDDAYIRRAMPDDDRLIRMITMLVPR